MREHYLGIDVATQTGRKGSGVGGAIKVSRLVGIKSSLASLWHMLDLIGQWSYDDLSETTGTGCPLYTSILAKYFSLRKIKELQAGILTKKAMTIHQRDLALGEVEFAKYAMGKHQELLAMLSAASAAESECEQKKLKVRQALAVWNNALLTPANVRHNLLMTRVGVHRGEECINLTWPSMCVASSYAHASSSSR